METNKIQTENKPTKPRSGRLSNYIKYTGVGVQIAGSILIGVFGGIWLDGYFQNQFKWFTVILTLVSIIGVLYSVSKEFLSKK